MEEKVLIKSEIDKKVMDILTKGPITCLGIAIFCSLFLSMTNFKRSYYSYFYGYTEYYYTNGWGMMFSFDGGSSIFCFLIFIIGSLALLSAIILGIMFLVNRKCELVITENNVKGRALFGKEVVLPLDKVSAYSTRKYLSTIAVSTSSGINKFSLIGNYAEIGNVLSQRINQRQVSTENIMNKSNFTVDSDDEMFKYKAYLDAGIITQEEFDAKKKQLLGL